jgi:oxygen-independent coproporphyrinogen III oxidase
VQSLDDRRLADLGRRHSSTDARAAFARLAGAGFATVSLDLIYGSPGDDPASWRQQLEEAVKLGPDHISCYQLTVHEGTRFGRRRDRGLLVELPEEGQAALFRLTHRALADLGFEGYEVSNFASSPQHRSRHNQKYWRHGPYLGLGPSAHSYSGNRRWWNLRRLRQWQVSLDRRQRPVDGSEELTPGELALEALMLGLRTADGVDLDVARKRWGVDLTAPNRALIARLEEEGLVRVDGSRVLPTLNGMAVADSLARAFTVPDEDG